MFDFPNGLSRTLALRKTLYIDESTEADFTESNRTPVGHNVAQRHHIQNADFFRLSDTDMILLIGDAFSDEIKRLQGAKSTVESSKKTGALGNYGKSGKDSPSVLLYGEDYPEVNRTIVGVLAFKWLINLDHESFAGGQNEAVKLKPDSFSQLRTLYLDALDKDIDLYALLVAMVINDVGKDKNTGARVNAVENKHPDTIISAHPNHDVDVYNSALNGLEPLIEEFRGTKLHKALVGSLLFGAQLNIAQLAQAENVPGNVEQGTKNIRGDIKLFNFKFLELILDVAGTFGYMDSRCAKTMIEPVCQGYLTTREALLEIIVHGKSARDGYDYVLTQRASALREARFGKASDAPLSENVEELLNDAPEKVELKALSVKVPHERALIRLLIAGRVTARKDAMRFAGAFHSLSTKTRKNLVDGLNVDGIDDGLAILPYYMPGLFAEVTRVSGLTKYDGKELEDEQPHDQSWIERRQTSALTSLMRFIARVYRGTKPHPGTEGRVEECDLTSVADVVKSWKFFQNLDVLDDEPIPDLSSEKSSVAKDELGGALNGSQNRASSNGNDSAHDEVTSQDEKVSSMSHPSGQRDAPVTDPNASSNRRDTSQATTSQPQDKSRPNRRRCCF